MRIKEIFYAVVIFFVFLFHFSAEATGHPVDEQILRIIVPQEDVEDIGSTIEVILQTIVDQSEKHLFFSQSENRFFEIYFDTPELHFLDNNGSVFYHAEEYVTKKKKKKKYHEVVSYDFGKDKTINFTVKHYSKIQTGEGKHPLFSLVKRKQRADFLTRLQQDGVRYPLRLKSIFQIARNAHRYNITVSGDKLLTIINNLVTGTRYRSAAAFGYVNITINQELFAKLDEQQKILLKNLFVRLKNNGIKVPDGETDYKVFFQQMEKRIVFFHLLLRYPSLVNLLYASIIGVVGFLLICFFLRKR